MQYDHKKIEKKWQEAWAKARIYETKDQVSGKENFYLLVEFPYPSGNLHVGHWYAFAVPDILARKLRMEGKNVLYPIGFDAFGLPAENAAIKNKVNPRDWTESNMDYMRKQIGSMGVSFDWSREVVTCHPDYYKWTQWLFLQLYKSNLVYRKETMVNWCPNDKTVLANEQVIDGKCERCGHEVIQKEMLQWNLKITEYADRLIDDLEKLDWPEPIKESQRNWIGRSEGAEIDFPLDLEVSHSVKPNYVLLHGFTGHADENFIPWVKKELESQGYTVQAPEMPNTDEPSESEQVSYVLENCKFDENTVILGHSLGTAVALKVIEKLQKPVSRLVTVGGFTNPNFKDKRRNFEKRFDWSFNQEKIRHNVRSITILQDPRDYAISEQQANELSTLLTVPITIGTSNEPHFTGDKEPDVLMWLRPTIRVFTTRPDTLFGATYLVLAPEHPWVTLALQHKTVLKNNPEVQKYVERASKKTELERQQETKEKTGVKLEGVEAINLATNEKMPLYVADYVLAGYGTGAIMAVPAHDERDFEFAEKFRLPIRPVVMPRFVDGRNPHVKGKELTHRDTILGVVFDPRTQRYLCLAWKEYPWTTFISGGIEVGEDPETAARREIIEETGYSNLKLIRVMQIPVQSEFFAKHKDVNRIVHGTSVLFELTGGERQQVSADEQARYDTAWLSESEISQHQKMTHAEISHVLEFLKRGNTAYIGTGVLVNSNEFDGLTTDEAKKQMTEKFGRRKTTYKLRDWIVSRQRYWGVPIPIIHCAKCGIVPVSEEQLPVLLPETDDYLPDGKGKSPLAKVKSFVNVKCPQCAGDAERETDTLDTFVDSSWYFLRYSDPHNEKEFAAKDMQANWMPVDMYSGGAEHTTMHLLYSRFWHKALFDRGLVADNEPYLRRMNRGIILGPDGQKMSKSKGNVIDPDDVVGRLGSDTVRMYLAFIGPYNEVASYPWNPDGVVGIRRFLERVWKAQEYITASEKLDDAKYKTVDRILHRAIKKVGEDSSQMKFNTAISQMMILLNAIEKDKQIGKEQWDTFLKLLAPFAPHMAEELWHESGHDDSVHLQQWPVFDPKLLVDDEVIVAIQIDGKTRDEILVASDSSKDAIEKAAREKVAARLEGKTITRIVVVPNRMINFVVDKIS